MSTNSIRIGLVNALSCPGPARLRHYCERRAAASAGRPQLCPSGPVGANALAFPRCSLGENDCSDSAGGLGGSAPGFHGRVGRDLKDVCLVGAMLLEKTSARLNSYWREEGVDAHERPCYYAADVQVIACIRTQRSRNGRRSGPRCNLAQTGTSSVHSWPKSAPDRSQMSQACRYERERNGTL